MLALEQVDVGQVQLSLRSGRRALALSKERKNVWAHIYNTINLMHGLLEAGAYEEALVLMQQALALARTLPPTMIFQRSLMALGRAYQALQQWEEAQGALEEAEALAETVGLGAVRASALPLPGMHYTVARECDA